jgi:hypothetical protein
VKKLLLIVTLMGAAASSMFAAPLCTDVVTTAASFAALGAGGCQFGDKLFSNFTYTYTVDGGPGNVPAGNVNVTFFNLGGDPNKPVVRFTTTGPGWTVRDGHTSDISISYTVDAPSINPMTGASMTVDGVVSNVSPGIFMSLVAGAESICCPGPGNTTVDLSANLVPLPPPSGPTPTSASDSKTFAGATHIILTKDIFLFGGGTADPNTGNIATVTQIDEGLFEGTTIPEPMTFVLFGSGMVGFGLMMKMRNSRKS